jgi:hypothetical protein
MKLLSEILMLSQRWGVCWWNDECHSRIVDQAHRLGLVYRLSVTQVFWTARGVELYRKYAR